MQNNNLPSKKTVSETRKLRLALEHNDSMAINQIKGTVTIRSILEGKEPNFMDIKRMVSLADLIKPVQLCAEKWLVSNGLNKGSEISVAAEFAVQIVKNEPTWTLLDALHFFDHISGSQYDQRYKIYGKEVTALRLMEMVPAYEETKAEIRERMLNEKKNEIPVSRENSDKSVKAIMGKSLEAVQIRDQDKKALSPVAPDEHYFNRNPELH